MSSDLVSRAIEAYVSTQDEAGIARLKFAEGLWEIQDSFVSGDTVVPVPDAAALKSALVAGRHALLEMAPAIDRDRMGDAVSSIAGYVAEHAGLASAQSDALRDVDFHGMLAQEDLDAGMLMPESFITVVAERWHGLVPDVAAATWAFVLTAATACMLMPLAKAITNEVGGITTATWSHGTCPVCGAAASAGRMGEHSDLQGGRRHLWCALCGTEWECERLRCVRCGNRDTAKLRYTYVEGDSSHRVHLCDECHAYVRFSFEGNSRTPTVMKVEDVVMTSLDAVAREAGYSPLGDKGETAH